MDFDFFWNKKEKNHEGKYLDSLDSSERQIINNYKRGIF